MCGKWDKTRMSKPRQAQQMQEELQALERHNAETTALQQLLHFNKHNLLPGDYRTQTGYHVRISNTDGEGVRHHQVPLEEQHLAPGALWLPSPPLIAPTETPVSAGALWVGNPWCLWAVKPQHVGFDDLGEAPDGKGNWCRYYQLKQMTVKEVDGGKGALEYEAVSSGDLDLARPYLRAYASGGIEEVLPVRIPFHFPMAAPTQLLPNLAPASAPTQQAPHPTGDITASDSGYASQQHNALNPSSMLF